MRSQEAAILLRVFIGESDRFGEHPLYEGIVLKAREQGLAGATVLRGPWALDIPAASSIPRKFCVFPKISQSSSRLSIASKTSPLFCRCSIRC
jgi:hypothetical protein